VVIDATNGNDDLRGVVAIGASAGGVEALSRLAAGLSADVPYAYLMVLHVPAGAPSILARIIDRNGPLPAATAPDGATLRPGHIYVGSPDHHLLVADDRVVLSQGPTENGHRPAINALFRSVAVAFGPRAIGVLLSGVLYDGVLGLAAIRSRGGVTIGQSPHDALFPALPTNARDAGVLDRQAAADEIGGVLEELSHREIEKLDMDPDAALEFENRTAMTSLFSTEFDTQQLAALSGYTCPDCNGSLTALGGGHFRCRAGHAWPADALLAASDDEFGGAVVAPRSPQEKAKLARQLAGKTGPGLLSRHYSTVAEESERTLTVLSDRLAANGPRRGNAGG
jgi:two-component system, chemotaxis family, protein-glutamate methylesterase/glutaminase